MAANVTKKEAVALLLAAGRSIHDAAAEAGVSERQIHRWRGTEEFRKLVGRFRGELLAGGMGVLLQGVCDAASTLRSLLKSKNESVRLQAARSVLQVAGDMRKTIDQDDLIEELRAILHEQGELIDKLVAGVNKHCD